MMNSKTTITQQKSYISIRLQSIFLLCFFLLTPNLIDAQPKSKNKVEKVSFHTFQGGVFYDLGRNLIASIETSTPHLSVQKFGLGVFKFKNNHASQFIFEGSYFSRDFGFRVLKIPNGPPQAEGGIRKTSFLFELEYFNSMLSREQLNDHFHIGYILNAGYRKTTIQPWGTNQYPQSESCFCIGAGIKAMYVLSLTKKSMLLISSDINLVDVGIGNKYKGLPSLKEELQTENISTISLIRPRFGIDIGVLF